MIGYTMVGTNNLTEAARFYDAVLAPLGLKPVDATDDYIGYAPETALTEIEFYVTKPFNGEVATFGNGTMIALQAETKLALDLFHRLAVANGGTDEGAPGPRLANSTIEYTYTRDLDGNKICAFYKPAA